MNHEIREKQYFPLYKPLSDLPEYQQESDLQKDFKEATHQISRMLQRPLETNCEDKYCHFVSWRGRAWSIIHLGKTIIREPFRLLKHLIIIIVNTSAACLYILNIPFEKTARDEVLKKIYEAGLSIVELPIRPFAFALDIIKLSSGFLIHPYISVAVNH